MGVGAAGVAMYLAKKFFEDKNKKPSQQQPQYGGGQQGASVFRCRRVETLADPFSRFRCRRLRSEPLGRRASSSGESAAVGWTAGRRCVCCPLEVSRLCYATFSPAALLTENSTSIFCHSGYGGPPPQYGQGGPYQGGGGSGGERRRAFPSLTRNCAQPLTFDVASHQTGRW